MSASNSSFIRGAAILALIGVASRVIGAVFRIVLAAVLGDEGIGLYQYAYPVYSTLLVISTAGIPVALSKMMAEKIALDDHPAAMRVFRIAFILLALSGLGISLVMFLGAEIISLYLVKDIQAILPIKAISPAIFFVTVMASLRGFFQGQQNMVPTALSQLMEQLVRVAFSIALVIALLPAGLEFAAAGATSGASAGGLAGLLLLGILYVRQKGLFAVKENGKAREPGENTYQIIRRIFALAVPVTVGGLVIPLISLIDLAVVPRRLLAAGFDLETARALYGQLTGMASSVVYFPNVVALALSMSLVPAISYAYALNDRQQIQVRSGLAIKVTMLFALPSAAGLFLLAEPITLLLFNNAQAGYSLAYMSWSVIPLCLYVTTTGLLQGLGKPIVPALNMFYGGVVKTILAWFLTASPELNVGGAALASVIGVSVAAGLNLWKVKYLTKLDYRFRELLVLPIISTLLMSAIVKLVFRGIISCPGLAAGDGLLNALATFGAITGGFIIYGLALLFTGALGRDELRIVPILGPWLARLTERFNKADKGIK